MESQRREKGREISLLQEMLRYLIRRNIEYNPEEWRKKHYKREGEKLEEREQKERSVKGGGRGAERGECVGRRKKRRMRV